MKYNISLLVAMFTLLTAGAMAQSTIVGTDHDFSNNGWAQGQICLPCHTPHAVPSANLGPNGESNILWNHELTTATFTMYSPLDSGNTITGQPGETSKMCLSCHDGTTAIDSYGGTTGTNFISGGELIGTDLRDDHPIGLVYPTGTAGYNDPSTFPATGVKLVIGEGVANRVECNSCHDPHGAGFSDFLRGSMSGSALCLQCHDK